MTVSKLLTPEEVADLLCVTTHTLAVWRSERRYNLPYVKAGRLVRYLEDDVRRFIETRLRGRQEDKS
jgi:excisionase family DNA binding protein